MTDEVLPNPNSLSPQQARERQSHLTADPTWRDAYLSGSGPHVKEFNALQDRISLGEQIEDVVANAGANVPVAGGPNIAGVSRADVTGFVQFDKQVGVHPEFTSRLLGNVSLPPEEYARHATGFRVEKFGSPQWRAALFAGDAIAYRELMSWMHLVVAQKGAAAPTIAGGR